MMIQNEVTPKMVREAEKILATPPPAKWTPARAAKYRWARIVKDVELNTRDAFLSACALAGVPLTFAEHDQNMRNSAVRNQWLQNVSTDEINTAVDVLREVA